MSVRDDYGRATLSVGKIVGYQQVGDERGGLAHTDAKDMPRVVPFIGRLYDLRRGFYALRNLPTQRLDCGAETRLPLTSCLAVSQEHGRWVVAPVRVEEIDKRLGLCRHVDPS